MNIFYKGKVREAYISYVKAQLTGAKISCLCAWLVYPFDKYRGLTMIARQKYSEFGGRYGDVLLVAETQDNFFLTY